MKNPMFYRSFAGLATAAAMTAALAVATPVFAQQTAGTPTTTATPDDKGPAGRLEKYHDAFRASDLVGATVYNDQGNTVGKINDLLLDTSGKADKVIISVGGFLGIGTKYVDVSFDQLKIEPSHEAAATVAVPSAGATSSTASAGPSKQYFSLVMSGATKDSLTSMPEFKYTS